VGTAISSERRPPTDRARFPLKKEGYPRPFMFFFTRTSRIYIVGCIRQVVSTLRQIGSSGQLIIPHAYPWNFLNILYNRWKTAAALFTSSLKPNP